ncbi:MAG: flippase-like domain-containing protein [Deltaproteobacteria bacterium]|jgi:glycosyltransferase 2 family protein|nr:flippase-like domain-containing protein [Deltaproteobacteria bacterium]MBT6432303.1 flippase-like domain-containing protein [Deltaproteobacteria bacterium]MBT6488478.1 flippase-like domain-containing protein [Deltaproteobacteria bacterium]
MRGFRRFVPGLIVSLVLLYWVFRGLDTTDLMKVYRNLDAPLLFVSATLFIPMQLFRLGRWILLTSPLGVVSFREQIRISIVGNALTILLPLRLGEFSRPAMLKSVSGVPVSSGLGVTALERVLDGLLISGVFWALIPFMPIAATENKVVFGAAIGSGLLFSTAALALVGMATRPQWIELVGLQTMGRLAPSLWEKVWELMKAFVAGLQVLRGPRNILAVFGATVGYWGANALVVAGVAAACGMKLPWVAAPLILCVLVFAIMLPSAPGFLGTYQAALVLGLSLFDYQAGQAATYAMVLYPLNMLLMVGMALPYVGGISDVVAQTKDAFRHS